MRNGQNNKRMRNRNNNNNNRRGQNPMTRVFESNGPDIKIRGTASHIAEKYLQLARDARGSGDPVAAENYYQHAEHYFRLIAAAQEQFRQNQQQPPRPDFDLSGESDDGEGDSYSNFGAEPGFVPVQPQNQPQPYLRDNSREQPHRGQPQQAADSPENGSVDRLPSFITGAQPNGGANAESNGHQPNGGERYPRRRRRPHGPRPDNAAQAAPSEDAASSNE
jgi:hypothetical protein